MGIFKLHSDYKPSGDQPEAIKKLIKGVEKGRRYQTLLGVTGSGKTFTMANVISRFDRPVLVMAPNKSLAAQLYQEYKTFFPENSVNYFVSYYDYYQPEAYLPASDTYIDKEVMINEEIDKLRHQATSALMTRKDVIVVASVSCIYNLGLPLNYMESALHLELGKPIARGDLIKQLVKMQFNRNQTLVKRGEFRVRGDVFEICPASAEASVGKPAYEGESYYQIKIDGQKISYIAIVDSLTRNIKEEPKDVIIFPPKHFISSEPQMKEALKNIKDELKERLAYFKKTGLLLEAERLERRTRYDMEMLKTLGYCHGVENYSRHLTGKLAGEPPDTLLAYFPKNFLTIIDESHIAAPQIRGMYEGDKKRKESLVEFGWRLPSALDNRPLRFEEFEKLTEQTIFTSATPGKWELGISEQVAEQVIRPTGLIDPPIEVRPVLNKKTNKSQVDDVMKEIIAAEKNGERVIINALTKKMAEELAEFLLKNGIKANYMHSETKTLERIEIISDFRKGVFDVLVGVNLLREGLDLPEVALVVIFDADREGFLRSEQALIQTMGRAARNVSGKVILYADNITGSMKRAIDIVERRRKVQIDYNKKHKITPKGIKKEIKKFL